MGFGGGSSGSSSIAGASDAALDNPSNNEVFIYDDTVDKWKNGAVTEQFTTSVRPELFGAIGDGETDDTAAFVALLAAGHGVIELGPKPYLVDADVVVIPPGGMLRGTGSSNYLHGTNPTAWSRIIVKSNSGSIGVSIGTRGTIRDVAVFPENYAAINFYAANYPEGTGNIATGVYLTDRGVTCERVLVAGFSSVGISAGVTSRIHSCYVRSCETGYYMRAGDGWMTDSVAMFCYASGVDVAGAYWRFTANRIEWNARYGIQSGGHGTFVGNLFDRNGWAGLRLKSGSWGQVVTGNYFSRNGAGGDGSLGRWQYSTPTNPSYVETTPEKSCHIEINYQRAVTITGNRFSRGTDDSGGGTVSPCYIYSSETSNTGANVLVVGNAGERGTADTIGYNAAMYSGIGAIAGGSDPTLIEHLHRPFSVQHGIESTGQIKAAGFSPTRAQSPNSPGSYTIPVQAGRSGTITLSGRSTSASGMSVIYWTQDLSNQNLSATYENKIGTMVSAVSISNNGANDNIVVTASGTRSYNYIIHYASQSG